jgi:hypothetical protein
VTLAPRRRRRAPASPCQRHVLDAGAGGDLLALQFGQRLDRAVLGDDEFVQHELGIGGVGAENLEQAGLRDLADGQHRRGRAVGAAVGAAGQHGFHDLLGAGELERLDVQAGFLEVALFDGREERQARGNRPEADADLGACLRVHCRCAEHAQCGGGSAALKDAAAGGGAGVLCHGELLVKLLDESGGRSGFEL